MSKKNKKMGRKSDLEIADVAVDVEVVGKDDEVFDEEPASIENLVNEEEDDLAWEEEDIEEEGQLSVDVYQTRDNIVIKSTIAGVEPEDVDISIDNDMITIRGRRQRDLTVDEDNYFYQECYWGGFSRSIILPVEILADKVDASIRNGILTVTLPKAKRKDINIKVKDDN